MMVTTDTPSVTAAGTVVTDQALKELNRLVTTAIEQHFQGNTLAASSSLVALISVADPLITELRQRWLANTGPSNGEDGHEPGVYL